MGKKNGRFKQKNYIPFFCATLAVTFVTGIYFVALLGTKQVGSKHNVSSVFSFG